ncbi:putative ribonuclease H protein [Senna tora]|uniref:Putative ribonuclease H protein n=1 Tax=Senna tora TaxID=362788 RepID=A0A834TS77_9FABA|nr:putative ribonuclease H protein [Senna tora]
MWVVSNYDYSSRLYHANILEWLVVEAGEWRDEKLAELAMAIYYAWERRNKKKFNNEIVRVEELRPRVERIMKETQAAAFSNGGNGRVPTSLCWEKPEHPFVKLNVDAVVVKEGDGVLSGLIQDGEGCVLGVFSNKVQYPNDPVKLEAMAIREGMELARKMGCSYVIVEGDTKLVMEMFQTKWNQSSSLNALCRDILRFKSKRCV